MKSDTRAKIASDEMDINDENLVGAWSCKLVFM